MDEKKPKYRIGTVAIIILVFFAIIADGLGMIPFVKDFTASIFFVCASVYFWMKGMGILNGKKLAAMAISWIASMIPIIQEIPLEVTAGIIAIILITRIEDKTGISVTKPLSQGKKIASPKSMMNFAGRREPPPRIPSNQGDRRSPSEGQMVEEGI